MDKNKAYFQLAWGIALVLMGITFSLHIPELVPKIKTFENFASVIGFIYFCLYLLACLLIFGGARKIFEQARKLRG